MKSKLNFLIGNSFGRKVNTKWFKIVNIIILLAIVMVCNIDSIISFFGGDFDNKQRIYVIDNTNESFDIFKEQMLVTTSSETEDDMDYEIKKYEDNEDTAEEYVKDNPKDLIIVFNNDEEKVLGVKLISQEYIDILDNQYLTNSIYNTKVLLAVKSSGVDPSVLANIYQTVDVERIILDETKNSEDENMSIIMTSVFPVVILPFFMLVIFLVQMIGAEVNEEKTTRGMEIIISSVSPATHFFSKIIASNLFVIMQGVLLFVYVLLGLGVRKLIGGDAISGGVYTTITDILAKVIDSAFGDKLVYIIPLTLVLMLLTFLAYSLLAGVLASMTTNIEDFQQLQTPIMIVLLAGYYLSMLAGTFKGALFIRILAYIPFISAILSPSLLVLGQIGIFDVCIAILFMIGTIYLLIKYGLRIYKVGILNYSSNKLWKKMFKAMKN